MNSGVYQIMNRQNYHMYVGSTVNFNSRWNDHKKLLRKGKHSNIHLQNAWNKYGESSFDFSIIEYVDRDWTAREQYYTDLLHPEYAIRKDCVTSSLGCKHTNETKQKISKTIKTVFSNETRTQWARDARKHSNSFLGKRHSESTKLKLSDIRAGVPLSAETRAKMSISRKGKKCSEQTRLKISASLKGRKRK